MLALFTLLPMDEVDAIVAAHGADPARREGQRRLATEVTTLVHGPEEAAAAGEAAAILFGGDPTRASAAALAAVAREVPCTGLEAGEALAEGVALARVLVRTGLASSLSDARRQLSGGAVAVNGAKVAADRALGPDDVLHGEWIVLRKGKRDWAVVEVTKTP
jgi:tyrosyl-tRNA synthetase